MPHEFDDLPTRIHDLRAGVGEDEHTDPQWGEKAADWVVVAGGGDEAPRVRGLSERAELGLDEEPRGGIPVPRWLVPALANLVASLAAIAVMGLGITALETANHQLETSQALVASLNKGLVQLSQAQWSERRGAATRAAVLQSEPSAKMPLVAAAAQPQRLARGEGTELVTISLQSLSEQPLSGRVEGVLRTSESGAAAACQLTGCSGAESCACPGRVEQPFTLEEPFEQQLLRFPVALPERASPPCATWFDLRYAVYVDRPDGREERVAEHALRFVQDPSADGELCGEGSTYLLAQNDASPGLGLMKQPGARAGMVSPE